MYIHIEWNLDQDLDNKDVLFNGTIQMKLIFAIYLSVDKWGKHPV